MVRRSRAREPAQQPVVDHRYVTGPLEGIAGEVGTQRGGLLAPPRSPIRMSSRFSAVLVRPLVPWPDTATRRAGTPRITIQSRALAARSSASAVLLLGPSGWPTIWTSACGNPRS